MGTKGTIHSVSYHLNLLLHMFNCLFQVTPILGFFLMILCCIFVVEPVRGQIEKSQGENEVIVNEEVVIRHSWFDDVRQILRW